MKSIEDLNKEFCFDDELLKAHVPSKAYNKYLDAVNEILAENSYNIKALKFKQMILFLKGKYKESLQVCDTILQYERDDIDVLITKSNSLLFLEEYADCVVTCQEILAIDPKNENALQNWEDAFENSGHVRALKPPRSFLKNLRKSLLDIWFYGLVLIVVIFFATLPIWLRYLTAYLSDLVNKLLG